MKKFPSGFRFAKNETWDILQLFICPKCRLPTENPAGLHLENSFEIFCETCNNRFTLEEGLDVLLSIEEQYIRGVLFSNAHTIGKIELEVGMTKFLSNKSLGLDKVTRVIFNITKNHENLIPLYNIQKKGVFIGITKARGRFNEREFSISYLIEGDIEDLGLSLWKSLFFKSYQLITNFEYSLSIVLSSTAIELLMNELIANAVELNKVTRSRIKKERIKNEKTLDLISNGAIPSDNQQWLNFKKNTKVFRNRIVHEGYRATKFEAKEALKSSILFSVYLLEIITDDLKVWFNLPERNQNLKKYLLPRNLYKEKIFEMADTWDSYNMEILAHSHYIETLNGFKRFLKKIKKKIYNECENCSFPLVPRGSNKPFDSSVYLWCIKCEKSQERIDNLDGAYFGRWLTKEKKGILLKELKEFVSTEVVDKELPEDLSDRIILDPHLYNLFINFDHDKKEDQWVSFNVKNLLLIEFQAIGDEELLSFPLEDFKTRWKRCPKCGRKEIEKEIKKEDILLDIKKKSLYGILTYYCDFCSHSEEIRWINYLDKK